MKRIAPIAIAPYAAWMALMMALPAASWSYAVRTCLTAALVVHAFCRDPFRGEFAAGLRPKPLAWGVAAGLFVLAFWVLPDSLPWYRRLFVTGDPYAAPVALPLADPLTWIRLFGSAFVISAAEELFFRRWLLGFAGFAWMVALFAVEHDRWLVGAAAGAVYAFVYLRQGLLSAIVAHAMTNLALGLFVIVTNRWEFW